MTHRAGPLGRRPQPAAARRGRRRPRQTARTPGRAPPGPPAPQRPGDAEPAPRTHRRPPQARRRAIRTAAPDGHPRRAGARPAAAPSAAALPARGGRSATGSRRYWFAERLLAVLSGQRPVHWMLGHTVGEAYEQLVGLASHAPLRPRGADRTRPSCATPRQSSPGTA